MLGQLVGYLEAAGATTVSTELAVRWAQLPVGVHPNHWAKRLRIARGFAAYLQTIDPTAEIPPPDVFPHRRQRATPYLFSQQDICRLLAEARRLRHPLRAASYEALFGLLAVSGMRIGEAIALERSDVDLEAGVITIRKAKGDRVRLVPLHPTAAEALRRYASVRDRLCPTPRSRAFFLSSAGTPVLAVGLGAVFREIMTRIGVRTQEVRPRIHDLRHRFAVQTLIDWQLSGVRIDEHPNAVHLPRARQPRGHVLVLVRLARTDGARGRPARRQVRRRAMSALAPSLQSYFTDRLIAQRGASPNTIAAYCLTFRLLLRFASERTGKPPSELDIAQLDAPLIAAFLNHLEKARGNSVPHPQQPPGGDPLAVRIPGAASPRARRLDPTGTRDPAQADRAQPRHLPHQARGRRAPGCLRPDHLDRPTRPRDVRAHDPGRTADLRARRAHLRRHHARHRRQRAHDRAKDARRGGHRWSSDRERCSRPG